VYKIYLRGKSVERKKIANIDSSKDNVLPELNRDDLEKYNKESKPVLLKKVVIDRNRERHPDISEAETAKLIEDTLYNSDEIIPTTSTNYNNNYYHFIKYGDILDELTLIELSDQKSVYEIVHFFKLDRKKLERIRKVNR
jgi:hypothetical protein